ncbi:hypothetical protein AT864_02400 [Anoxybacillus sp. P3H1B]|jgi:hypothetical protein|uniref:DUF5412 domain-containing protein n=1 Tax=Anoxybacillus sp. P3H1B TaxID=1769293 RepID=UPI000792E198|nr:DUF5412 domain-containing protein [Anoxybacillus sp. P3H1B]KXG09446.1 hypothetical protein AT864_02400 [Anoxybacillus sp. P3H1B]
MNNKNEDLVIKKTKQNTFIGCLITLLILAGIVSYFVYYFMFSMSNLPKGEFIGKFDSPNKVYSVEIYRVDSGATTSYSIRGELVNNKTNKRKNIYWEYKVNKASVEWENDYVVVINEKKLDVRQDIYDWRRQ